MGPAPPDFSLYFRNTKSQGANWTFSKLYISPRIRDLHKNTRPRGQNADYAKRPLPTPSRKAAKEYTPRRTPWDPETQSSHLCTSTIRIFISGKAAIPPPTVGMDRYAKTHNPTALVSLSHLRGALHGTFPGFQLRRLFSREVFARLTDLPRQQRHSRRHEHGRDPSPLIHLLTEETSISCKLVSP